MSGEGRSGGRGRPTREEAAIGRARVAEVRSRYGLARTPLCRPCRVDDHDACRGSTADPCGCDRPHHDPNRGPRWRSPAIRRYRRRPTEIDAARYDGTPASVDAVLELADDPAEPNHLSVADVADDHLDITTLAGPLTLTAGEWLTRTRAGHLAVYSAAAFREAFDPVESP